MEIRMSDGWRESAPAWITSMGDRGDFSREFVLDGPMIERVRERNFQSALDVGCGEGRFCRMLRAHGIKVVGIDPTEALVEAAWQRDPQGDYRIGRAEALAFPNNTFDLVISYLTLIDIPDVAKAIAEMGRVLRPGGTLLIANLTSFSTAGKNGGWSRDSNGELQFCIDHYLEERAEWVELRDIRIRNWHRPMSSYMRLLLAEGLILRAFEEPAPVGGDPEIADRCRRVPWFVVMEWEKPKA
nr:MULTISPECIES: class I SAM-dependent methyltransferase [Filomicrobium]